MDIFKELYDRNLYYIVEDILCFTDTRTVKACFLVCEHWNLNFHKYSLWKRLFDKQLRNNPRFLEFSHLNGWQQRLNKKDSESEIDGENEENLYENMLTKVSIQIMYNRSISFKLLF
jgi:hypothetical protein